MQDLVTQANCILDERCVGCSEWLAVLINSHGTSLFLSIKCKCLQWLLFKCGWKVKAHTYSLVWGLLVAISMLNLAWVSELGAFCGSCTGVSYSPSDGGYFMPPVDPWIGDAMTSWPGRCSKVWPQEVGQWCRTMKCSSCTRWATRMIKTWLGGWSISCAWRDWESWSLAWRRDTPDGIWSVFINIVESVKEISPDSSLWYTVTGQEVVGRTWKRKLFLSIKNQITHTVRLAEHWNRLLGKVVESQSLEIL